MSVSRQTQIMESELEQITGGMKNINTDHSLIHDGYGMSAQIYIASMSNGQALSYSFKAPTTRFAHLKNTKLQVLGGSVKCELLDGVSVTVDTGTAVSIVNLNRNSDVTATSTIKAAPTYTGGTAIYTIYALCDSTNQVVGTSEAFMSENQEIVTEDGDKYYVLKFTNLTTDTITNVVFTMFFYEESQGLTD